MNSDEGSGNLALEWPQLTQELSRLQVGFCPHLFCLTCTALPLRPFQPIPLPAAMRKKN